MQREWCGADVERPAALAAKTWLFTHCTAEGGVKKQARSRVTKVLAYLCACDGNIEALGVGHEAQLVLEVV